MKELPKKVKATLERLNIKGVVSGYFTQVGNEGIAAFTGWNKHGNPVCVLVKPRGEDWKLAK